MEAIRTDRTPAATGSPSRGTGSGDRVFSTEGELVSPGTNDVVSTDTEVQTVLTTESTPVLEATANLFENTAKAAVFVTERNTSENHNEVMAAV